MLECKNGYDNRGNEFSARGMEGCDLGQFLREKLTNHTFVRDIYRLAEFKLHEEFGYEEAVVSPTSRFCRFVNKACVDFLNQQRQVIYEADYLEYESNSDRGVVAHAFGVVNKKEGASKAVVDLQYKQFVPVSERDSLPDWMVIPFKNKGEVEAGLREHKVSDKYHDYWMKEIFGMEDLHGCSALRR